MSAGKNLAILTLGVAGTVAGLALWRYLSPSTFPLAAVQRRPVAAQFRRANADGSGYGLNWFLQNTDTPRTPTDPVLI